jgi:hypothetical protein
MILQLFSSIPRLSIIAESQFDSALFLYSLWQYSTSLVLQDDAIRNLFSAKTFHEYSAKSLITFLVPFSSVCIYNILPCFVADHLVMLAIKSMFCLL